MSDTTEGAPEPSAWLIKWQSTLGEQSYTAALTNGPFVCQGDMPVASTPLYTIEAAEALIREKVARELEAEAQRQRQMAGHTPFSDAEIAHKRREAGCNFAAAFVREGRAAE